MAKCTRSSLQLLLGSFYYNVGGSKHAIRETEVSTTGGHSAPLPYLMRHALAVAGFFERFSRSAHSLTLAESTCMLADMAVCALSLCVTCAHRIRY